MPTNVYMDEPTCPECDGEMVLRKPRDDQDWNPFWGCASYPRCKGTVNIEPDEMSWADFHDAHSGSF
jgi:ssDNA-binding Zn-finger/Zn-ribbon topoisomerase 1